MNPQELNNSPGYPVHENGDVRQQNEPMPAEPHIPEPPPANAPIIDVVLFAKQIPTPSSKMFELNRRLQENQGRNGSWWDTFVNDFFDDSATLTLCLYNRKKYNLGRGSIPGFFQSFFDGQAVALSFNPRHPQLCDQEYSIMYRSEYCVMETDFIVPVHTKAIAVGCLLLEFIPDVNMRIRSWHYTVCEFGEFIPRAALYQNPCLAERWSWNVTPLGVPVSTLNYLNYVRQQSARRRLRIPGGSHNCD